VSSRATRSSPSSAATAASSCAKKPVGTPRFRIHRARAGCRCSGGLKLSFAPVARSPGRSSTARSRTITAAIESAFLVEGPAPRDVCRWPCEDRASAVTRRGFRSRTRARAVDEVSVVVVGREDLDEARRDVDQSAAAADVELVREGAMAGRSRRAQPISPCADFTQRTPHDDCRSRGYRRRRRATPHDDDSRSRGFAERRDRIIGTFMSRKNHPPAAHHTDAVDDRARKSATAFAHAQSKLPHP